MSSTFTSLLFHIVYSTKYQWPRINVNHQERMHEDEHVKLNVAVAAPRLTCRPTNRFLGLAPQALCYRRSAANVSGNKSPGVQVVSIQPKCV